MDYKSFLNKLLDTDTNLDWKFPFENKKIEIKYKRIKTDYILNNLAFSFLPKHIKKDTYQLVIDSSENNKKMLQDIEQYFTVYYEDMKDKFSNSNQMIEKVVESLIDWIDIVEIDISNKIIEKIHSLLPTKNKYFWFSLVEKFYLTKKYEESYYLINRIQRWGYINEEDDLSEDIHLYKLMCLNEMKFHKNKDRQEEVISIAEALESYDDISLVIKLEYYTLKKDKEKFDNLVSEYEGIINEYSIDELINIFELAIICKASKSYYIIDNLLKSRDVPYHNNSLDYDIYMLLTAIYYGEISKVLKSIQKIIENYPYAYDFDHIIWYYRNNRKTSSKIKSLLKNKS